MKEHFSLPNHQCVRCSRQFPSSLDWSINQYFHYTERSLSVFRPNNYTCFTKIQTKQNSNILTASEAACDDNHLRDFSNLMTTPEVSTTAESADTRQEVSKYKLPLFLQANLPSLKFKWWIFSKQLPYDTLSIT